VPLHFKLKIRLDLNGSELKEIMLPLKKKSGQTFMNGLRVRLVCKLIRTFTIRRFKVAWRGFLI
jgi:hypothetical protein